MNIRIITCPECGNKQKTIAIMQHRCVYCGKQFYVSENAPMIKKARTIARKENVANMEDFSKAEKFVLRFMDKNPHLLYWTVVDVCYNVGMDPKEAAQTIHSLIEKNKLKIVEKETPFKPEEPITTYLESV